MKANDRNQPDQPPDKPFGAPLSRAAMDKIFGGAMGALMQRVRGPKRRSHYSGPKIRLDGHDADRIDAAKNKRARKNQRRLNEAHR